MGKLCGICTARDECDKNQTWEDSCAGFTNMPLGGNGRVVVELKYLKDCEEARNCAEQLLMSLCPEIKPMKNLSGLICQISHWCWGAKKDIATNNRNQ